VTSHVDAVTRIRSWPVPVVGLLAVLGVAIVRMLTLAGPAPSGIDGGNWLAFGDVDRAGVVYPPVVPFLFANLVSLVGAPAATSIAAAVAIGFPAMAVLLLAAWAGRPLVGVFAGLFVVASPVLGEAVAWGGYPQPIATAAAILALVALAVYAADGRLAALAAFGTAFAVVAGTSHLVAVPTAVAGVVILVAQLRGSRAELRRGLSAALVAAIPLALLAPTYLAMFATLGLASASGPDVQRILGPLWFAYPGVLAAVLAGALFLRVGRSSSPTLATASAPTPALHSRDRALLAAAAAASIAWSLAFLASGEPRLLYDLPTLVPLGAVALVPVAIAFLSTPRLRFATAAILLGLCTVFVSSGLAAFPGQVAFYRVMTPGELAAMSWLARQPLANDQVLVADRAGVPLGWWAEGLTGREAVYASELRWLRFDAERQRARVANVLLYQSGFPGSASASAMAAAGIRYVLLPYATAFGVDTAGTTAGWRIAFVAGDSVVMAPDPAVSAVTTP
jgi:hypothetical protein